jgi:hypothetical protein
MSFRCVSTQPISIYTLECGLSLRLHLEVQALHRQSTFICQRGSICILSRRTVSDSDIQLKSRHLIYNQPDNGPSADHVEAEFAEASIA